MTDKVYFFQLYRDKFKPHILTPEQVTNLCTLIDVFDSDKYITDRRQFAYLLATIYHECNAEWKPIAEYGKGRGRSYGRPDSITGQTYYGRGFVQLTWKANYQTMSKVIGEDLVNQPYKAMISGIATKIIFYGMKHGSFTGKNLDKYINDKKCDYRNARRIINGTDKAELIESYARKFEACIIEQAEAIGGINIDKPNPMEAM